MAEAAVSFGIYNIGSRIFSAGFGIDGNVFGTYHVGIRFDMYNGIYGTVFVIHSRSIGTQGDGPGFGIDSAGFGIYSAGFIITDGGFGTDSVGCSIYDAGFGTSSIVRVICCSGIGIDSTGSGNDHTCSSFA